MTRTENDLRGALRQLAERADQQGAPSATSILTAAAEGRGGRVRSSSLRRLPRWLPPLTAAAAVAAVAVTAVTLSTDHNGSSHAGANHAGGRRASSHTTAARTASPSPSAKPDRTTSSAATSRATTAPDGAATMLDDAAATLDAAPWRAPGPRDFYYVRTSQATTWTSVSGRQPGQGRTTRGISIPVLGCAHGRIVPSSASGNCTLNDVPHYLADAPTVPSAWDTYLEHMAPGSRAGGAQGKIIVQVLHQDLVATKAAAALLRYTASCPGLHTLPVRPVDGEQLIGVTCTSMTNGSYGLALDAASHALVGFVVVTDSGHQDRPAEIVRQTGIVPAIGRTP